MPVPLGALRAIGGAWPPIPGFLVSGSIPVRIKGMEPEAMNPGIRDGPVFTIGSKFSAICGFHRLDPEPFERRGHRGFQSDSTEGKPRASHAESRRGRRPIPKRWNRSRAEANRGEVHGREVAVRAIGFWLPGFRLKNSGGFDHRVHRIHGIDPGQGDGCAPGVDEPRPYDA